MFYNCTLLSSENLNAAAAKIFSKNKVTNAQFMFGSTNISEIPTLSMNSTTVGLFHNQTSLWNIDGMFSNCTNLSSLPVDLFGSNDLSSLKYARALFANCTNLQGVAVTNDGNTSYTVPKGYFSKASHLTHIGAIPGYAFTASSGTRGYFTIIGSTIYLYYPGMFANTKVKVEVDTAGVDSQTFINDLSSIKDVSYLFFIGDFNGVYTANNQTFKKDISVTNPYDPPVGKSIPVILQG